MTGNGSKFKSSCIQEAALSIIMFVFSSQSFILLNELHNRMQSWIYLLVILCNIINRISAGNSAKNLSPLPVDNYVEDLQHLFKYWQISAL